MIVHIVYNPYASFAETIIKVFSEDNLQGANEFIADNTWTEPGDDVEYEYDMVSLLVCEKSTKDEE